MPGNNFSVSNIVDRIMLVLPSKFSRDTTTNLYAFFNSISEAFKLNTDLVDELFRQTNLVSATGAYVDDYITDLTSIGRKSGETDAAYKARYWNNVFKYNCTKNGLELVVIDIHGSKPEGMYNTSKRGAFLNARYYYNDTLFRATYGEPSPGAYKGYIQLSTKPTSGTIDELCKVIDAVKASGVKIYLYYPEGT